MTALGAVPYLTRLRAFAQGGSGAAAAPPLTGPPSGAEVALSPSPPSQAKAAEAAQEMASWKQQAKEAQEQQQRLRSRVLSVP